MTPFRLALLSLTRRKTTSLIAIIAIALSVACSGVLLRMYELSGSRFSTMGDGGDAIVAAKSGGIEILLNSLNSEGTYPGFLPYNLFASLRTQQTVHFEDGNRSEPDYLRFVVPVLFFAKHNGYRVMGTDDTFFQRPDKAHEVILASGRTAQSQGEIVIGAKLADDEGLSLGAAFNTTLWTGDERDNAEIPFKVVGILAPTHKVWDTMAFATVEQAQNALAISSVNTIWSNKVLNYFFVYLKPNGAPALEKLINGRTVGQVAFVEAEKQKLFDLTGTGKQLGFLMAAFIIGLGGLCVAGMLITRFDAMATQIAVLRAIGYSRVQISLWLMLEGTLLGAISCLLGATLDAIALPLVRAMLGSALPAQELANISIWHSAPVWAAALLSTVVAIIIPLVRFYRQDVHLSLRSAV